MHKTCEKFRSNSKNIHKFKNGYVLDKQLIICSKFYKHIFSFTTFLHDKFLFSERKQVHDMPTEPATISKSFSLIFFKKFLFYYSYTCIGIRVHSYIE